MVFLGDEGIQTMIANPRDILLDLQDMDHMILTDENNNQYLHSSNDIVRVVVNRLNFTDNIRRIYKLPDYIIGICWIDYTFFREEGEIHTLGEVSFNEDIIYKTYLKFKEYIYNTPQIISEYVNRLYIIFKNMG